jgi:hypothetical protein
VEFGVEAPCSASRKRGAGSGKSSISRHPSELRGGAGVVESMAVSGLSKSPAPGAVALSARRLTSLASASEALKSPSRRIGSSTPCQKNWPSISTTEGSGRGSPRLPPELSLCADPLWSTEPPLSSAAASSTPPVLFRPRPPVVKPCACSLASSSSSIVGRSRSSSVSSLFSLSLPP